MRHHPHVILHLPTKFRPNRNIRDGVMTSYQFSRWRPHHRNSIPGSVLMTSLICEGRNLPASQISTRCFNPGLRYYYFRFMKRNVRHVGILLPVWIFRFASPSARHSASAYQTSSKSEHPRRSYDVISLSLIHISEPTRPY